MIEQNDIEVIEATKNWIEKIVIGLGLCPFAAKPYTEGLIDFEVIHKSPDMLVLIQTKLKAVIHTPTDQLSNGFIILPELKESFEEFLDFFYQCEVILEEGEMDGDLQLTSFHPDYLFAGEDQDAASNYTNRSPHPMIHFLRKAEVSAAIESYGDTSSIYKRNVDLLNRLGLEKIKALLT